MIKKQLCFGSGSTRLLANDKSVQCKGEEAAPNGLRQKGNSATKEKGESMVSLLNYSDFYSTIPFILGR